MNSIRRKDISTFLKNIAKDKIFHVEFIKKTDGSIRNMNCRLGVTKFVKGVRSNEVSDKENGLLTVWDTQKKDYRRINIEGVLYLKVNGKYWTVK
jgi:hypothetical protein